LKNGVKKNLILSRRTNHEVDNVFQNICVGIVRVVFCAWL
jgi:hypothetical protein